MSTLKSLQSQFDKKATSDISQRAKSHSVADIYCNSAVNSYSLDGISGQIYQGIILDTCPITYSFKVMISGCQAPIECSALQTGGGNGSLLHDSSTYATGTPVLVFYTLGAPYGTILGAMPIRGGTSVYAPRLKMSSFSKNYADATDKACLPFITEEKPDVGIHDFGVGLPIDSTEVGEFSKITATGVRFTLNPFMTSMAVDDYTGLWVFDLDSLIRLSGINLQVRTSGREEDYFNDNGEYIEYKGCSLYPWEQLGRLKKPDGELIKKGDNKGENTWQAYVEPAIDKAKPFHRVMDFGGWLGQGKQTQIAGPPDTDWAQYGEEELSNGLQRLSQSIDGMFSLVSANGIAITKRGVLSAVTRKERPDDTSTETGDNADNYEPNTFDMPMDIPTSASNPAMERVMGLPDYLGYKQNFTELLPFLKHKKDYYVPEDSELNAGLDRNPKLGDLNSKHLIKSDLKKTVALDDNSESRKEQEVYALESGMVDLPDGSKVIYGGNGEEIRMVGGSIFFEAPGDIHIKAGRNIVLWAGNDLEERAKNCADISTSNGSLCLKAENHLKLLGGNNEKGGVLIEGKGKGNNYDFTKVGNETIMGGVTLKASNGTLATLGETIYSRSGVNENGMGIIFDACGGEQDIYTINNSEVSYTKAGSVWNFADTKSGIVEKTARIQEYGTYVPGSINIDGDCKIYGSMMCTDSIAARGELVDIDGTARNSIRKYVHDDINDKSPEQYTKKYNDTIGNNIREEYKIGNSYVLVGAGFSFRNDDQYAVPSDFAVYESRWQNIGASQGVGVPWKEPEVTLEYAEKTKPYPGKNKFDSNCFVTQEWTLIDSETGLYKDRWDTDSPTEPYKNPKYGTQKTKQLNEYPVIK